jgi:hypothetical protein
MKQKTMNNADNRSMCVLIDGWCFRLQALSVVRLQTYSVKIVNIPFICFPFRYLSHFFRMQGSSGLRSWPAARHIFCPIPCNIRFWNLNMFTRDFSCDPIYHPNGGVADFKVIHAGETLYASKLFRTERLAHLLDKWEGMTGQRPAYKIKAEQEVKERERIAQQRELRESMRYDSPRQSQGIKM